MQLTSVYPHVKRGTTGILNILRMRSRRKLTLPVVLQSEATECGLACLAMISGFHGRVTDLFALRRHFSISMRGTSLAALMRMAGHMGLACRALRVELDDMEYLSTPCILHWNMTHFVVLKEVGRSHLIIHDPSIGRRRVRMEDANRSFTGVALELVNSVAEAPSDDRTRISLKRLVGNVRGAGLALAQISILACGVELLTLAAPLFLKLVVDRVLLRGSGPLLTRLGVAFIAATAVASLLGIAKSWSTLRLGTSFLVQLSSRVFAHLISLPAGFFEKRHFGDILSHFDSVGVIRSTLSNNALESLLDGSVSVVALCVLLYYSPLMTGILLFSVAASLMIRAVLFGPAREAAEKSLTRSARQQSFLIESLRGIRTIKLFGREYARQATWLNHLVEVTNAQVAVERLGLWGRSGSGFVFGLEGVLTVWVGASLVLGHSLTLGVFAAFLAYQEIFKARISVMIERGFDLRLLALHKHRLADLMLAQPEEKMPLVGRPEAAGGIDLRSVSFRYSDTDPWVLKAADFSVRPGECVAIVGRSGTGKSTLLKLIAGLLQPVTGAVHVGRMPVTQHRSSYPGSIACVLQDDCLFSGTIRDNIAFASDEVEMSRVEECARLACIDEVIGKMAMGYDTLIGDMGVALSGGQQQRILLARALYSCPDILILDEATSHLDQETEDRIARALAELRITRVLAAHRPSTVAIASRVVTLDHSGQIAESSAEDIFLAAVPVEA